MIELSLSELEARLGIKARTIRSYIEKGLLPGPEGAGPKAYYTAEHLERLKAVKFLRDVEGLSLDEIRRRLLAASRDEIREIAEQLGQFEASAEAIPPTALSSALDYIRAARSEAEQVPQIRRMVSSDHIGKRPYGANTIDIQPQIALSADMDLFPERRESPDNSGVRARVRADALPRRARTEIMTRIEITPDVDLVIRGDLEKDRLWRLEQIANHLRELLLKE